MKKLSLTEWAAISEIVGTTAVVVSLLFIAYNLNRNTVVLSAANDNILYQLQDAALSDELNSPWLTTAYVKRSNNENLTDVEESILWSNTYRYLNMWELAYGRQAEGLLAQGSWLGWDSYYASAVRQMLTTEQREEMRHFYGDDFLRHVEASISNE